MPSARFEIMARSEGELRLSRAVLIYQQKASHDGRPSRAFATLHDIQDVNGVPTIQAGKAMTPRAAARLAVDLGKGITPGGFLPPTVLYMNGDLLMWWVPPSKRHIWFKAGDIGPVERGAVVPHPGLIFAASSTQWSVWAVKGNQRPTPQTAIYQAPYFNVDQTGGICQGNVITPSGTTAERIGAWNGAFFDSYFTHPGIPRGLLRYRGGACEFWRHMLDGQFATFPARVLVNRQCLLQHLLQATE